MNPLELAKIVIVIITGVPTLLRAIHDIIKEWKSTQSELQPGQKATFSQVVNRTVTVAEPTASVTPIMIPTKPIELVASAKPVEKDQFMKEMDSEVASEDFKRIEKGEE
jgi:hypothetical protein